MAVIALDLGGTKLAAALLSDTGEILISETIQLKKKEGTEVGKLILQQANFYLTKCRRKKYTCYCIGYLCSRYCSCKNRKGMGAKYSGLG